ncbi:MAG: phosphoribosylformylglycinamidine synthase subunit PurQ [Pirellulales bacterium]|nr:phosphoribosylformylglycinamidine synthase subunit PurQ [Pirellulales bacterium]
MPEPRVLILRAPGTNCDRETAFAFETAGARCEVLHVNRVLESPGVLDRFQILCIPGGFSYGDDVAAGRILANQMQHHLADAIARFKDDGKLILGICNGFQALLKSGVLLTSDGQRGPAATLTWNDSGRYEDRWVRLRADGSRCVFLQGIDRMYLPVAHAEGKFVPRDAAALAELDAAGQVALRYVPLDGATPADPSAALPFPDNPNGSPGNVAGVCDPTGRVLGLMPHPERHIDPTHHPRWTRADASPAGDGLALFANAVAYFTGAAVG